MDKKDKILIIVAPVAVLTLGYVFFGDKFAPRNAGAANVAEDFTSIEAPVTETRKNRTELYRDKYEKENADKLKRNVQSDEFFFGEEITRDSVSEPTQPETTVNEPETEQPSQPETPNTKQTKPKVIVKYIERPNTQPKTETPTQPNPEPETRNKTRRAGFVSEKTLSTPNADTTPDEVSTELNIPVVIQESIDVKSGSNIQMRTLEEVKLNGVTIPKNTLITGIVAITQERINVKVNSIKGINRTVQMKLNAYDLDGNEGMPVEGGVNKEIKKDVVASAIQETGKIVNVPILNRLPTNAGNKKINDPVIPVPKGYKLFLKPESK